MKCECCNGKGIIPTGSNYSGFVRSYSYSRCGWCNGKGFIPKPDDGEKDAFDKD